MLSSYIFNQLTELIFRAIEREDVGFSVGGRRKSYWWYADDAAITAENENELQILAEKVNQEGKDFGKKMKIIKTKTMITSRKSQIPTVRIHPDGQETVNWAR